MPSSVSTSPLPPEVLARAARQIPSGPRILPRLQRLLQDSDASLEDILEPIRVDQGIAARILQIGNSPLYAKGGQCQTIEESINRLGLKRVYTVASNALCSESLVRPLKTYGLKAEDFWKLSLAGGIAAECLAVMVEEDRNAAYTIGLMHGLGMVVIDNCLSATDPAVRLTYRSFEAEYTFDEKARLGCTQAEAAAALLQLWGFPVEMSDPLLHQYRREVPREHAKMVAIIRAAKWLRNLACGVHPPSDEGLDPAQLQVLGLRQPQLDDLLDQIRGRMQESRDLLAGG